MRYRVIVIDRARLSQGGVGRGLESMPAVDLGGEVCGVTEQVYRDLVGRGLIVRLLGCVDIPDGTRPSWAALPAMP